MSNPASLRGRASRDAATARRDAILAFIRDYVDARNCSPTRREIAEAMGVTTRTVFNHLGVLQDEGKIQLGDGPRAIGVNE